MASCAPSSSATLTSTTASSMSRSTTSSEMVTGSARTPRLTRIAGSPSTRTLLSSSGSTSSDSGPSLPQWIWNSPRTPACSPTTRCTPSHGSRTGRPTESRRPPGWPASHSASGRVGITPPASARRRLRPAQHRRAARTQRRRCHSLKFYADPVPEADRRAAVYLSRLTSGAPRPKLSASRLLIPNPQKARLRVPKNPSRTKRPSRQLPTCCNRLRGTRSSGRAADCRPVRGGPEVSVHCADRAAATPSEAHGPPGAGQPARDSLTCGPCQVPTADACDGRRGNQPWSVITTPVSA